MNGLSTSDRGNPVNRGGDSLAIYRNVDNSVADAEELLREFDENGLSTVFTASGIPGVEFTTPFEVCLRPFLEALGWEGDDRQVVEALPHMDAIDSLDSFRAVLSRLGYRSRVYRLELRQLDPDQLPALAIFDDGKPTILLPHDSRDMALAFDPEEFDFREVTLDNTTAQVCVVIRDQSSTLVQVTPRSSWFFNAAYGLRKPIVTVGIVTFLSSIVALATPIYVMTVYNIVINAKSTPTLYYLFSIVLIFIFLEVYLKRVRGQILAFVGARLSAGVMNSGFSRLLGLPIGMIESAPIGTQIIRLKQFEGIHTFFTGAAGAAILDLPFTFLFFATIAFINPILATIPIGLACVYAVLALVAVPGTRARAEAVNSAVANSNSFLMDSISKRSSVNQLRVEREWQRRFTAVSRELSLRRCETQYFESLLGVVSQSLVMVAGVITLVVGANLVMSQELSIGGLIAVMMLIWRVLSPIQTILTNLNRINQFVTSIKQIDLLMKIPLEHNVGVNRPILRKIRGRITLVNVGFRYGNEQEPVFRGLSLDIQPKQFVCIASATSGGKSTILKLILGLYKPQAGAVFIDGLNIQQLEPTEVRASISYLPLGPKLFYGTIAQNLRLSAPAATDAEVLAALEAAGIDIESPMFPDGIETRLTSEKMSTIPIGIVQSLALSRMYCRQSAIYLMNDPASHLDEAGQRALLKKLGNLKGKSTIVLISNREEHLTMADRVIKLANGAIAEDYVPEQVS